MKDRNLNEKSIDENSKYHKFLLNFTQDQKDLFVSYINDTERDFSDLEVYDNMTGELHPDCSGPGRPSEDLYKEFTGVSVIKQNNDWTIFGNTRNILNRYDKPSFSIDLLESRNIFTVRIGTTYPYETQLSNTNAISYRMSSNRIIIRALSVPSTGTRYCRLIGMIAAETTLQK